MRDYTLLQMWDYHKWSCWFLVLDYDHENVLHLICLAAHALLLIGEHSSIILQESLPQENQLHCVYGLKRISLQ